jgi:microcystin-dependent protein
MGDWILGQIMLWPGVFIPEGWALCDGSKLPIQQNAALYSLLGTTYGGDGKTYFLLPDLRSIVPMCVDTRVSNGNGALGKTTGVATYTAAGVTSGRVTLVQDNLPAHTHVATFAQNPLPKLTTTVSVAIPAVSTSGTTATNTPGSTTALGAPVLAAKNYNTANPDTNLKPFDATGTVTIQGSGGTVTNANTGAGTPISINLNVPVPISTIQPSLYLNYIIATTGIYPPRS